MNVLMAVNAAEKKSRLSSVKLKTALDKKLDKPTNSYSNVKRIIVYPSSFVNACADFRLSC